jgi:hypothetical protein
MSQSTSVKLLPRNAAALRAGQTAEAAIQIVAGNPIATRLEAGVGNCFPGLEFDMRNLERRFFPFLQIEFGQDNSGPLMAVVAVDTAGVQSAVAAGALTAALAASYGQVSQALSQGAAWRVARIAGDFGPLGQHSFDPRDLRDQSFGANRLPSDAWTAARMLVEDSVITLTLARAPGSGQVTLTGRRVRYLDPNGALARIFEPGELTQSLCSPWTHDFRDCACFYWASNHPDVALPPTPAGLPTEGETRFNLATAWERADRALATPPIATAVGPSGPTGVREMPHHTINRDWQLLNFVLERRERLTDYAPLPPRGTKLPDRATLIRHLRYAAGVELAVMQEYLCAAWSLRPAAGLQRPLQDDVRAAFAELLRIAIGEMRHLRAVNNVLAEFGTPSAFQPALAVASELPGGTPGVPRPLRFRAATPEVIDDFIAIEAPSNPQTSPQAVDGLYVRILATLEAGEGTSEQQQTIRTVMAEGEEHWQTFRFIKEWLGRHQPATYLRAANLQPPAATNPAHQTLQQRYRALLMTLEQGYRRGIPAGAPDINAARGAMLGPAGIQGAMDAVAAQNVLVVFDPVADPKFAAIPAPPP